MYQVLKVVHNDFDGVITLNFTVLDDDGVEGTFDSSGITDTKVIVHNAFNGSDYSVLSSNDSGISWNATGKLTMLLGDNSINTGDFYVSIIIYDPGHVNGQHILSKDGPVKLRLRVV